MKTIGKISLQGNSANELLLTAAAETRLRMLSRQADNLLQDMTDSDPVVSELLHGEAVRLFSACFDIVCLLGIGDLAGACRVSADGDLAGATLGLSA